MMDGEDVPLDDEVSLGDSVVAESETKPTLVSPPLSGKTD